MTTRLLLVDDDEAVLEMARIILSDAGHDCAVATSGGGALAALKAHAFDLLATDIVMPDMEGVELIVKVRASWPGLPILAFSGGGLLAAHEFLGMARAMGAGAVLRKPLTKSALLPAVAALLGRADLATPEPRAIYAGR